MYDNIYVIDMVNIHLYVFQNCKFLSFDHLL